MNVARRALAVAGAALALAGCPHSTGVPDGGPTQQHPPPPDDAGRIIPPDWVPPTDAGYVFQDKYPTVECPVETYSGLGADSGYPEHSIVFGICVALHTLSGQALLNDNPVQGLAELHFVGGNFSSQIFAPVDPLGAYRVRLLRTHYDIVQYHPDGIFPTHKGFNELPDLDMTKDQVMNLAVTSYSLRGGAFFAGLPFTPVAFPPDVMLRAAGIPKDQTVGATSQGGTYELALMKGTMALLLNTPPAALQDTELVDYPLTWSFSLTQPSAYDINVAGSELQGDVRVDGMPLDDRKPGYDFELHYTPSGEETAVAITHHEGGIAGFHSILPKGKYGVTLHYDSTPDRHYPAMLWNKAVAQQIDLTEDASLTNNLTTVPVEGGIVIDGQSPQVNPGYNWVLYMYATGTSTDPWFFAYYKVPLDSGSFQLRVFPGVYYVAIQLGDELKQDMVDGWFRVSRLKEITGPDILPIVIDTSLVTGKLLIDGQPPPLGLPAGVVTFKQSDESYKKTMFTAQDGAFQIRVPKGAYEVYFTIDRTTYPLYASGPERLISRLEMFQDQVADLNYNTVPVIGPLRVDNQTVAHNTGGDDIMVHLTRDQDMRVFDWGFRAGTPNYLMRIPQGQYSMMFEIMPNALPDTAYGTAPMGGYEMPAVSSFFAPPPAR
jgi:hypothetical protein